MNCTVLLGFFALHYLVLRLVQFSYGRELGLLMTEGSVLMTDGSVLTTGVGELMTEGAGSLSRGRTSAPHPTSSPGSPSPPPPSASAASRPTPSPLSPAGELLIARPACSQTNTPCGGCCSTRISVSLTLLGQVVHFGDAVNLWSILRGQIGPFRLERGGGCHICWP